MIIVIAICAIEALRDWSQHSPTLYFCATRNYQQQSQLWFDGHFLQLSYLFLFTKLAI